MLISQKQFDSGLKQNESTFCTIWSETLGRRERRIYYASMTEVKILIVKWALIQLLQALQQQQEDKNFSTFSDTAGDPQL